MARVPLYLANHADTWRVDPRAANLAWFRNAHWGLFIHYGLYAQHGLGEWHEHRAGVPRDDYEQLFERFDPGAFDAEAITDLALTAEMQYITLTACHHEGFCLWRSAVEPFNAHAACGRDLVRELAAACARKGLGLFLYYTYVLNWHRDDAYPMPLLQLTDDAPALAAARARAERDHLASYWRFAHAAIGELCDLEFPLAGIWLDIIRAYYLTPQLVPAPDTYALVRQRRPEALISFKQGATGEEDFAAPEHSGASLAATLRTQGFADAAERAEAAWRANRGKPNEICTTLQHGAWGYQRDARHLSAEELWHSLGAARAQDCRLLANVGPLADGSIHGDDLASLHAVGERIRREGWPTTGDAPVAQRPQADAQ